MKKFIIVIVLITKCIIVDAQVTSYGLGNASCEDFILYNSKIYFTGSYQHSMKNNENNVFLSNSPGSFFFFSIDTLLKNSTPIITASNGSFIRGKKIIDVGEGRKVIICQTSGTSEIGETILKSYGGWDILLLFFDIEDKLIGRFLFGSEANDKIIDYCLSNGKLNIIFNGGKKIQASNKIQKNNQITNDFLYQLDLNNFSEVIYELSSTINNTKEFTPVSFKFYENIISIFGYYSKREEAEKLYSIKDFGILSGMLGAKMNFDQLITSEGIVSKSLYENDKLLFDITSYNNSLMKSSFYLFENNTLIKLQNNIQGEYYAINNIGKAPNGVFYFIGTFQQSISDSIETFFNSKNEGSFIYYLNINNKKSFLEDFEQPNINKMIYNNDYYFVSSSYTNNIINNYNNPYNQFNIIKLKNNSHQRIEEIRYTNNEAMMTIYPNPVVSIVSIQSNYCCTEMEIKILNIEGKTLFCNSYENSKYKPYEIDISALASGFYFVYLYQYEKLISTQKFIVTK